MDQKKRAGEVQDPDHHIIREPGYGPRPTRADDEIRLHQGESFSP